MQDTEISACLESYRWLRSYLDNTEGRERLGDYVYYVAKVAFLHGAVDAMKQHKAFDGSEDVDLAVMKAVENLSQSYTQFLGPLTGDSTCKSSLFTVDHLLEIHRGLGAHGVFQKCGVVRSRWLESSSDSRLAPCLIKHAVEDLLKVIRDKLEKTGHGSVPEIDATRALIEIAALLIKQFSYIQPFEEGNDTVLRFLVAYVFNQVTMVPIVQELVQVPIESNPTVFEDEVLMCLKKSNALISDVFGNQLASKPTMEVAEKWRPPW